MGSMVRTCERKVFSWFIDHLITQLSCYNWEREKSRSAKSDPVKGILFSVCSWTFFPLSLSISQRSLKINKLLWFSTSFPSIHILLRNQIKIFHILYSFVQLWVFYADNYQNHLNWNETSGWKTPKIQIYDEKALHILKGIKIDSEQKCRTKNFGKKSKWHKVLIWSLFLGISCIRLTSKWQNSKRIE